MKTCFSGGGITKPKSSQTAFNSLNISRLPLTMDNVNIKHYLMRKQRTNLLCLTFTFNRPIAYCLLHVTYCILYIAYCTFPLHIAYCMLHDARCTLHVARCTLHVAHCTLHMVKGSPRTRSPKQETADNIHPWTRSQDPPGQHPPPPHPPTPCCVQHPT